MDARHIAAIVTAKGSTTSHTAILARMLELPALAGVGVELDSLRDGDILLVDGASGFITLRPTVEELRVFGAQLRREKAEKKLLLAYKDVATKTTDGTLVQLFANIGNPCDTAAALANGAQGIGLLRSEFLYMNHDALPSEEEQYLAYSTVLKSMAGRPVVVRTLDIGGDKNLPTREQPREENPFLGWRAIRMCLDEEELFMVQLRALLRAGVEGNLQIMFPMISDLDELRQAKALLERAKEALNQRGVPCAQRLPVGMMVEIPGAAVMAEAFAKEVDFFSIGTNDLTQYTTATERGNARVQHLYTPFHHLAADVISAAHRHNIPCGMCGEAAADPNLVPLWLGMGLDEFSVGSAAVLKTREIICSRSAADCRNLWENIIVLGCTRDVKDALQAYSGE